MPSKSRNWETSTNSQTFKNNLSFTEVDSVITDNVQQQSVISNVNSNVDDNKAKVRRQHKDQRHDLGGINISIMHSCKESMNVNSNCTSTIATSLKPDTSSIVTESEIISALGNTEAKKDQHLRSKTEKDKEHHKQVKLTCCHNEDKEMTSKHREENSDSKTGVSRKESSDTSDVLKSKKKRFRRSYSCGPCKTHKIKCDMQTPCGNCIKYGRAAECLKHPPNPPTYQQYLIKQERKRKYLEKRYNIKLTSLPTDPNQFKKQSVGNTLFLPMYTGGVPNISIASPQVGKIKSRYDMTSTRSDNILRQSSAIISPQTTVNKPDDIIYFQPSRVNSNSRFSILPPPSQAQSANQSNFTDFSTRYPNWGSIQQLQNVLNFAQSQYVPIAPPTPMITRVTDAPNLPQQSDLRNSYFNSQNLQHPLQQTKQIQLKIYSPPSFNYDPIIQNQKDWLIDSHIPPPSIPAAGSPPIQNILQNVRNEHSTNLNINCIQESNVNANSNPVVNNLNNFQQPIIGHQTQKIKSGSSTNLSLFSMPMNPYSSTDNSNQSGYAGVSYPIHESGQCVVPSSHSYQSQQQQTSPYQAQIQLGSYEYQANPLPPQQ